MALLGMNRLEIISLRLSLESNMIQYRLDGLNGSQWDSVVLGGTLWDSVGLGGTQWDSVGAFL